MQHHQPRTITTAFYDVMFGDKPSDGQITKLEQDTLDRVRAVLNNPERLNKHIPPLPSLVLELLNLTRDPLANFAKLAHVIEQDPSLSGRVLQLANSPLYVNTTVKIDSLEKAVGLLGLQAVSNIASGIIMEKIRPANPIYYKLFGKLIWDHSLQTAHICRDFAMDLGEEEFCGYFLGLIHDVGKIVIFNCLCVALARDVESALPNSLIFKSLMAEMSIDMSVAIALEWQLPDEFCQALIQQRSGHFTALGQALFKANLLSEIYLLGQRKMITPELASQIFAKRHIDSDYAEAFYLNAPTMIAHSL